MSSFEGENLLLHNFEVASRPTAALGSKVDGEKLTMEITDERLFEAQAGVQGLLARRLVAGWSVEVVVGHLAFCGVADRTLLKVLHTVYRFVRRRYLEAAEAWPECRAELRTFAALLFLAKADWTVPGHELMYQSDASEAGWGVKAAWWPLGEVECCGRVGERQRLRRVGPHSARSPRWERPGCGWTAASGFASAARTRAP